MSTRAARDSRQARMAAAAREADRGRRRRVVAIVATAAVTVAAVVVTMLLTSRPQSSEASRLAPTFTLTNTEGKSVSLQQYRGKNVVLYFNEGAGCQSCLVQMAEIEKQSSSFKQLGVTVLPIVMNSRDQIIQDMRLNRVSTPFLLDDGSVSKAYGTLGKGMHAGLPGHSFVLIDRAGQQRWYGEYPSMWLAPNQLLKELQERLQT
ncbi:peroxiredoxin family protein [Janibacter sp. G1551]|uniref:peroxiredoxin family protein n=1 Tax=Janibacter sp. G1551 TaxID=3420440 RepID=UPI003CFDBECE